MYRIEGTVACATKQLNAFRFQNVIEWQLSPSEKVEVETEVNGTLL